MSERKYSPKEAAIAVLNRAAELYKNSNLAKSEDLKKGDWKKIHDKLEREGYSKESADKIDGSIKAKLGKSDAEGNNPDEKADADLGEKVEREVEQHEEQNEDPKHEMRGHIKLAKFMGRMEHKRSMKKADGQTLGGAIGYPGAPTTAPTPSPTPSPAPMAKKESDFDKLKNKIKEKEGYSEKGAEAAAAAAGRKNLGQAEMTRRSVEGRKK